MEPAVTIKNVSVTLGTSEALKNVTIDLPQGKTIGVIGPSGAGKTTLIRGIVGRQRITTGDITVFGQPAGSPQLRKHVTYMTQELSVYSDLTVKENLRYFVTMTGQPKKQTPDIITDVLKAVDMTDKADSLVSDLSGGQKQRVSLAIALIGSPRLMVLDEPTVGLDPVLRDKLWHLFAELADKGTTLIITSHSMDEAERCDDLVLLRNGEVIAHSSPQQLLERTDATSVEQSFLQLVGGETA
ncbi:ABC transporter ATP-binding protein [Pedobacter sp.]|nr:ABC transporter ATP-binding protein [Candidatus Saccharibacteria bacterium]